MNNASLRTAKTSSRTQPGTGSTGRRIYAAAYAALCLLTLSACSVTPERLFSAPAPPDDWRSKDFVAEDPLRPLQQANPVTEREIRDAQQKAVLNAVPQGCSIRDRFDNSALVAWRFNDNRSRVGLKLKMDGPSLSDPGNFEFKAVTIRFTHQLQKTPHKKERCLYAAPLQGVVGSLYNELYVREDNTVWQELRARDLDFWNRR